MNKEQAIEFVKQAISNLRFIHDQPKRSLQVGYVNGLNSAFLKAELFTIDEFIDLQDLLTVEIIGE